MGAGGKKPILPLRMRRRQSAADFPKHTSSHPPVSDSIGMYRRCHLLGRYTL